LDKLRLRKYDLSSRGGMTVGVSMDFKSREIKYRAHLSLPNRGKALLYYGPDLEKANALAIEARRIKWYPREYIDDRMHKLAIEMRRLEAIQTEWELRYTQAEYKEVIKSLEA
jgi:hypothetical protein